MKFATDNNDSKPELGTSVDQSVADIYQPEKIFLEFKNYTTAIDVNPNCITPKMLKFRRQKSWMSTLPVFFPLSVLQAGRRPPKALTA